MPDSVIAAHMTVTGEIRCRGLLRINGVVEGALHAERVELGPEARFSGEANVNHLDCRGSAEGHIRADCLQLRSTSRIEGIVAAAELEMEAGAAVSGRLAVGDSLSLGSLTADAADGEHPADPAGLSSAPGPVVGEQLGEDVPGADIHVDIVDSIDNALQGGSQLLVVISDDADDRRRFCRLAVTRLADSYQVLSLADPGGSVKDLLVRIAEQLGVDQIDGLIDTETVWEALKNGLQDGQQQNRNRLLFIENGEKMFPATLEGVLRLLADPEITVVLPLVLTGASDLHKINNGTPEDEPVWEPDCLFILPGA